MDARYAIQALGISEITCAGGRSIVCLRLSFIYADEHVANRSLPGHINNLYNTTFWAMVQKGGLDGTAAEEELKGTVSSDKNEILFSRYGINYNNEPEMFRKGSAVFREYELEEPGKVHRNGTDAVEVGSRVEASTEVPEEDAIPSKTQAEKLRKARIKTKVIIEHVDIIKDEFWEKRPWILSGKPGKPVTRLQS
jgi:tRNA(His) guanylyltransferase